MKIRLLSINFVLFGLICSTAFAGNIAAGKNSAEPCLACHGNDAIRNNPLIPSLNGQDAVYLAGQLKAFRSGGRQHSTVEEMTAKLSEDDINNLADYFASLTPPRAADGSPPTTVGNSIFNMCMGCHGVNGEGRGQYPRVAGLQPAYITKQLNDYKNKIRANGPMQVISRNLTAQEITDLSEYIGSL